MTAPVFRPGLEKTLQDLHTRLKILEAIPGATGTGVTQVQSADSTVIVTNGTGPIVDLSVPPPASSYQMFGNSTVSDTSDYIPWDVTSTGATLIDTSVPDHPTFITDGTYIIAVTAYYGDTPPTVPPKVLYAELSAEYNGGADQIQTFTTIQLVTGGQTPDALMTLPVTALAGDFFYLHLAHNVGSAKTIGFESAVIVKVF